MSETTAGNLPSPDDSPLRERATLVAFIVVAIVATVAWLVLLTWLVVVGLRALGL
ncbi:MAG: hypothetical protein M3340_06465 [Actinomycetota bacterium]|nr:hypothetical protein [Actinomycetota bacterium]